MRTKEIVGAILALTLFLGIAPFALAAEPGIPFEVGGHVYLGAAAVSGADVTVTNLNTNGSLNTTTDSNGLYVMSLNNLLPSGHSAGDIIQVNATYNGMTGTSSAPRSENLSDSPQLINVTIAQAAATLGSITISRDSPDPPNIGGSLNFTAVCRDTNSGVMTCPTLTWDSSNEYAGTISDTGLFEALHMGRTEIYAANSGVSSNKVWVTVNEPAVNVSVNGTDFTVPVGDDILIIGNFTEDMTGEFVNSTPLGNATDPDYVTNGTTLGLGGNIPIKGVNMEVGQYMRDEMAAGNGSILIKLRYNDTELAAWGITDKTTLEIYKFNKTIDEWELVKDQWYYVASGSGRDIVNNEVWVTVTELCPLALVGTKTTTTYHHRGGGGGGGGATYPPGWYTTPAVTATAAHGATPGVTPGATPRVTPTPKKPVTAGTAATAAEGATAGAAAKKKTPGFEAVFAIAGLLAIAYVLMRRRE